MNQGRGTSMRIEYLHWSPIATAVNSVPDTRHDLADDFEHDCRPMIVAVAKPEPVLFHLRAMPVLDRLHRLSFLDAAVTWHLAALHRQMIAVTAAARAGRANFCGTPISRKFPRPTAMWPTVRLKSPAVAVDVDVAAAVVVAAAASE